MMRWSILPAYLVRLAGFAFDRLEPLRCPRAAAAAGALDEAADLRLAAGRALDEALGNARYADNPAFDDPIARKALTRQFKQARAFARLLSEAPPPADALAEVVRVVPEVAGLVAELDRAHAVWRTAEPAFEAAFADELAAARGAIRRLYHDARLQEAVFLQSPEAFEAIQQLLATDDGPRNKPARRRERLAAMYAQRFLAKNDTNSICGPIGIAYASPADPAAPAGLEIVVEDARRETYFSHWAAQRLLEEAVRRAGDTVPVTLRISPAARVEDGAVAWCVMDHDATMAFRRRYARSALPPAGARLLRALARPRTRADLRALAGELELTTDEIDGFLDQLVAAGIVLRGPTLPPGLFHPLHAVAAELQRWPASEARAWALDEVAAAEQLVARFAHAGLADRIALHRQLGARYEAATGDAASRGEGRHYADRSVIHEDCYVEVRAELGTTRGALEVALPALISALELPLELARERVREWFRARFGDGVRVPALEVHRAFDGDHVLDTAAATPRAAVLQAAIERVRAAFDRAVPAAGGPARLPASALHDALAGVTRPAHPGYVSADVMLRRLPAGGTELVLSEVHGFFWIPTCALDILPPEHRERVLEQMRAAVRDMARGRRTAECVLLHTQATDRRFPLATTDLQLIVASDRPDALDLGALELRLTGDDFEFLHGDEEVVPLVAFTRYPFVLYTSRIAPLYDDFSEGFFPESMLPAALRDRDAPRLVVDDLVIRRRVWRRPAAAVRAALAADREAELFRRAQALRHDLGCDAQVFVSLSGEPKPLLLDFQNVFLVEALASLLERQPDGATVKISEMLPGPGELVARGPDGLRTSELRMGFYRS
jgi:hypothetical protein